MDEVEHLWALIDKAIKERVSEPVYQAWYAEIRPTELQDDTLVLTVPNGMMRKHLEGREAHNLEAAKIDAGLEEYDLSFRVDMPLPPSVEPSAFATATDGSTTGTTPVVTTDPSLNPEYSFDSFVIGPSNRFAHAAALSVAERPARSYNPLFIYGPSGLGKTHLLHAIGHYVSEHYPGSVVRYVALETMLNEFIQAIQSDSMSEFKRRFRDPDVLLVDDIQFISGKERLQEEFFHTFSWLRDSNRQIVITSDRPPDDIPTLEDRLRTRFKWGLLTDVQPPDLETRIAILANKAEGLATKDGQRYDVPYEVFEYIAVHLTDNIRELEGALIRVTAYANLTREAVTIELARSVLEDVVTSSTKAYLTPAAILGHTAEHFGLEVEDLVGSSRRRPLVLARQISMYVFRQLTEYSYPAIGREFGDRDHTTVMHAVEKITGLMNEQREVFDQVTALIQKIKSR